MISVSLHEAFDGKDIAGEGERLAGRTSLECRIRAIVHLVEPIGRVGKFSLWIQSYVL